MTIELLQEHPDDPDAPGDTCTVTLDEEGNPIEAVTPWSIEKFRAQIVERYPLPDGMAWSFGQVRAYPVRCEPCRKIYRNALK